MIDSACVLGVVSSSIARSNNEENKTNLQANMKASRDQFQYNIDLKRIDGKMKL